MVLIIQNTSCFSKTSEITQKSNSRVTFNTNEMVKNLSRFKHSEAWRKLQKLVDDDRNVVVAHNAKFDVGMLNKEGIHPKKIICTLKMAKFLDKEGKIPQYNLQYLRYYLSLNVDASPHDALGDIIVLESLFKRIHAKVNEKFGMNAIDNMLEVTKNPILNPVLI